MRPFFGGIALASVLAASTVAPARAEQFLAEENRDGWSCRLIGTTPSDGQEKPPVVTAVGLQPGGNLLAAAGDDHLVRVWNLATGELTHCLSGHRDWVRTLAFSPVDGKTLATAGNDRRILLWDMSTGRKLDTEVRHDQAIAEIRFGPRGRWLAAVGFENTMSLYEVGTYRRSREISCPCRDMRGLAFSPDGRLLIAGGRNGKIRIWNCETGEKVSDFVAHQRRIRSIQVSPDGQRLVSAGEDGLIRVTDLTGRSESFDLARLTAKVFCVAFIDPRTLATAGSDNCIRIWDLESRKEREFLSGHQGTVISLDYREPFLVSGSYDTTLRLWQRTESEPMDRDASRPGDDVQETLR